MNEERELSLDELDIIGIIRDIIRNIWVIIMAAAACWMIATSVVKLSYQPEYSSTATFAIMAKGTSGSKFSSLATATSMADVLSEVFTSNVLRKKVSQDLNVPVFSGSISSEVISETNLLRLTVKAGDPKETYFAIRSVINNYSSVSDYIFGNAVMEVIGEPQIPLYPSNSMNMRRTQRMAALAGGAVVCMMVVFMSVIRNTVKSKRMAVRHLDGKYLGMVPHEEKNRTFKSKIYNYNKSVMITNAICSFSFVEAIEKLSVRIEYHMRKHKQKILMVTSIAENEGKTTVVANLASSLASRGYKVMVIDMDLRKPAVYKIFEQEKEQEDGIGKVLENMDNIKKVLKYDKKNKVFLLLNHNSYSDSQAILTSDKMNLLMKFCRQYMDYVILDTPPVGVSSDAEIISSIADASMLVVRQDWGDIRDINDGIDMLKQGKGEFLGYVLNNVYESIKKKSAYNYNSAVPARKDTAQEQGE